MHERVYAIKCILISKNAWFRNLFYSFVKFKLTEGVYLIDGNWSKWLYQPCNAMVVGVNKKSVPTKCYLFKILQPLHFIGRSNGCIPKETNKVGSESCENWLSYDYGSYRLPLRFEPATTALNRLNYHASLNYWIKQHQKAVFWSCSKVVKILRSKGIFTSIQRGN